MSGNPRTGADRADPPGGEGASEDEQPPVRKRRLRRSVVLAAVLVLLLIALGGGVYVFTKVPLPSSVKSDQVTVVTYDDGRTPIVRIGTVNRTDVPLDSVSIDMRHAVLAAEDKNFYSEPGISPRGIARAVYADVRGGQISQGGSTITQQYAKNAYLTQDRTFRRKIREIVLALKLDRKYSKDQILEFYLNTIYFGRGAYGVEAASQAYFGIPAAKLSATQGAVLAGLIRAPSSLDPRVDPAAARTRFGEVISTMVAKGWYDSGAAATATVPPTRPLRASSAAPPSAQAAYIREEVKRELVAAGISEEQFTVGGLHVETTIDPAVQLAAQRSVDSVMASTPAAVQTGLVAIDPSTGAIRAWYGGRYYGAGPGGYSDYFDNVTSSVQPGSSFKATVLATALDKGISLESRFEGNSQAPDTVIPGAGRYPDGVRNFGGESFGPAIDLPTATANSVNTAFVQLGQKVGTDSVIAMAHKLGIPDATKLDNVPSLPLGTSPVRPLDMAHAYATLASGGLNRPPHLLQRVTDSTGNVLYSARTTGRKVITAGVAADEAYALQQVFIRGTAAGLGLAGGRPVAGKTGTTTGNVAAWLCGYTPQLATAVAVFRDKNTETLNGILGINEVTGAAVPGRIFSSFMDAALLGKPVLSFPPRANVGTVQGAVAAPPSSAPPVVTQSAPPTTPPPSVIRTPRAPSPSPSSAPPSQTPPPTTAPPSLVLLPPGPTPRPTRSP